ncbi:FtsW/RodA/SpoVE family cell cycle protein [Enterococcus sp. 669A]|uniref:FtsW/RodA/SpoVE family cell cycle protein n=1 Tax=Candidatus Enterococcus moelleringii TaxID=2815325 RepID=A0ABS3L6I9_9ENTE|nr:FtsW/RodA/SpoVE family cell cycle protein [Enterococcus sp. 669A]MBO1305234.1 FtsW/RodA/SpoVE family cell cycle protein [Enterococcus sp. 669A]
MLEKRKTWNEALLLPIFLLLLVSVWVQYQAAVLDGNFVRPIVIKQLFFCALAFGALLAARHFSFAFLMKFSPLWYGLSLGVMLLLHWYYDAAMFELTGTKRWLRIGPLTLQPSEMMKIAFILMLVYITINYEQRTPIRTWQSDGRYMLKSFLIALPTFLLMFMQRDFGTSLVFICIMLALFIVSGVDKRILISLAGLLAVLGGCLLLFVFTEWGREILKALHFKEYQLNRVEAWVDPLKYQDSISFQQVRSMLAVATGGFAGKAGEAAWVYVPVRESDMIFTVIAETFGFVGSASVLFLYFYLFYQMLRTGMQTNKRAYLYFSVGLVFSLLFQTVENVGAAIGLLPLTGIPLPFLSQGGTSLITGCFGLGIVLGMEKSGPKSCSSFDPKIKRIN